MVKRSFLTMFVFLGSLGVILLGPGAIYADQEDAATEASEACEAWAFDYPGCWYEYASGYCPYPAVEVQAEEVQAEAAAEPPKDEPAEDSTETVAQSDGYLPKDYGYQWEYDDYDSAYEDYLWSELISDSQSESNETEQAESIKLEEEAAITADSSISTWAEDYGYWAEYYDDEYRCYKATVRPTDEPTDADDATIEEVVAETTGIDTAAEATEVTEATPVDSAMDWQHECYENFDFDYSYCYEYGYGYGYEEEPKFDSTISVDQVEIVEGMDESTEAAEEVAEVVGAAIEATEEAAEVMEHRDTHHEDYHHYGDCYYYSDYYGSYYDSYYRDDSKDVAAVEPSADDASDRLTDTETDDSDTDSIEEPAEVAAVESPALPQAAVLSLARSLDRMGSALKMLSNQLTDMVTPEVATRASTATDQH